MARKLYVTDDMGLDDALVNIADVSLKCALMWPWIVPYFDDWGRADANPRRLKGKIFPNFDDISFGDIQGMLNEYAAAGLIELYEVGGKPYMAVESKKWFRFQTHIHASKRTVDGSRYPAPPSQAQSPTSKAQQQPADDGSLPREQEAQATETEREPANSREDETAFAQSRDFPREPAQSRASVTPSPSLSVTVTPSLPDRAQDAPAAPDRQAAGKRQKVPLPKTEDEVRECFASHGRPELTSAFWDYWESAGWRRQGQPMADWRASVRTWIAREDETLAGRGSPGGRGRLSTDDQQAILLRQVSDLTGGA